VSQGLREARGPGDDPPGRPPQHGAAVDRVGAGSRVACGELVRGNYAIEILIGKFHKAEVFRMAEAFD
jgi:hypothetical protein